MKHQQWRAQTAFYHKGKYTMGPVEGITVAWYGKADRT
jgi:hypothetical protein